MSSFEQIIDYIYKEQERAANVRVVTIDGYPTSYRFIFNTGHRTFTKQYRGWVMDGQLIPEELKKILIKAIEDQIINKVKPPLNEF